MRIINITPLFNDHEAEVVSDLIMLREKCGVTDVAFMMPLIPEGACPTQAKAEILAERFSVYQQALAGKGPVAGILVQSIIGHAISSVAPYQRIVIADGNKLQRFCPLDENFRRYIRDVIRTICMKHPAFLIIDDDFRMDLMGSGCFCPLHLAEFNRLTGENYNRETLLETLGSTGAAARATGRQWDDFLCSGLIEPAHIIRAEIDKADPAIRCGFCTYIGEFQYARRIAMALAGNTEPFIRVNDAWYAEQSWYSQLGAKFAPKRLCHTAMQTAALKDVKELLAETDTYLHNQHYLSVRSLHAEICSGILNGVNGLKLWITTLNEYEPENGAGYRQMLAEHHLMYDELLKTVRGIVWRGPSVPLPATPVCNWNPHIREKQAAAMNWAGDGCGRLGIPAVIDGGDSEVIMLAGNQPDFFSDEELSGFCGHGLLLDGKAAEIMTRRGLSRYIGLAAVAWPREMLYSYEKYTAHLLNAGLAGKKALVDCNLSRLNPDSPKLQLLSEIVRIPWAGAEQEEILAPGITLFENELGGRVAVYAINDCSLLFSNTSRKKHLIQILTYLNRKPLAVFAEGETDIYVRHGILAPETGGGELIALLNLNMDAIPELRLHLADPAISKVERLSGNGSWIPIQWSVDGHTLLIAETAEMMIPMIYKLQR